MFINIVNTVLSCYILLSRLYKDNLGISRIDFLLIGLFHTLSQNELNYETLNNIFCFCHQSYQTIHRSFTLCQLIQSLNLGLEEACNQSHQSQNYRMACVERNSKDHPAPNPLLWSGTYFTRKGCSELHPTWI